MTKIEKFRSELNNVFDDNLHTKQWHNIVDYLIIGFILISTLEVFLSTYDGLMERYGHWLHIVDYTTTAFFTVEVILRIWTADLLNPKYKGFWGRVRYCFSFYGMIDIISTFPFYLNLFMNIPYVALKAFRIARLLRIFRYMKAFSILSRAMSSKKQEMVVSLQFLTIVTLILSFVLFFVEHDAQPDVYNNGWTSVVWAFAQYIGDPGGFADTPPITFVGRMIAVIIGILGIAIFAVPAGLIGSGFSEIMEEDNKLEELNSNIHAIKHSFKFEKDQQHTGLFIVPRYKTVDTIITRKFIPYDDILNAVKNSGSLHLYDLANAMNSADHPESKVVVVNCKRNTPYGCCIDRGSRVTIVSTSGNTEPCTSWFAYHIAKLGGFNFVAKEVETDLDNPTSYYNINANSKCPNLKMFIDDINRLASKPNSWVIPILGAIGTRTRPTQFHFCYNSTKGDESYNDTASHVKDYDTFDKMYNKLSNELNDKYDYKSDKNIWYAIGKENISHHLSAENIFTLRVECFVWMFDSRYMSVIKTIADSLHTSFEPEKDITLPYEMVSRQFGKDFSMDDYVD